MFPETKVLGLAIYIRIPNIFTQSQKSLLTFVLGHSSDLGKILFSKDLSNSK